MIRDIVRAALAILVLSVAAGLLVEVRFQLASIDLAHRHAVHHTAPMVAPMPQPEPQRIRRFGSAALELADSALGILR